MSRTLSLATLLVSLLALSIAARADPSATTKPKQLACKVLESNGPPNSRSSGRDLLRAKPGLKLVLITIVIPDSKAYQNYPLEDDCWLWDTDGKKHDCFYTRLNLKAGQLESETLVFPIRGDIKCKEMMIRDRKVDLSAFDATTQPTAATQPANAPAKAR